MENPTCVAALPMTNVIYFSFFYAAPAAAAGITMSFFAVQERSHYREINST